MTKRSKFPRIADAIKTAIFFLFPIPLCAGNVSLQAASGVKPTPSMSSAARVIANRVGSRVLVLRELPVDYQVDLQLEALLALGQATNETKYLAFVQEVVAKRESLPGYRPTWRTELYTSLPFDLSIYSGDRKHIKQFVQQSFAYRDEVFRSSDGVISIYIKEFDDGRDEPTLRSPSGDTYVRREWAPILLDHVQEYASRMAKAGCLTGNFELFEEAANQFELMRAALEDGATGLWAHGRGFSKSATHLADTKWGRGHAWVLRGLVETLTYLPRTSAEFARVKAILEEFSRNLLRYQDNSGFWHQVVDRADSFEETSATGLISYYFERAVQQQLLSASPYRSAARRAFNAIAQHRVSVEGDVYGGSKMTPPLPSVADYLERETPVNDGHAVAAVIFSAVGQIALDESSGDLHTLDRTALCMPGAVG